MLFVYLVKLKGSVLTMYIAVFLTYFFMRKSMRKASEGIRRGNPYPKSTHFFTRFLFFFPKLFTASTIYEREMIKDNATCSCT